MEILAFLPFLGGHVSLFSGAWLLGKKGFKEPSQAAFFLGLLSLGLFGIFETICYLTEDREEAIAFLKIGWSFALMAPYFIMTFATLLRGKNKFHIYMLAPSVAITFIANLYIFKDFRPAPWGWLSVFDLNVGLLCFTLVAVNMGLGFHELFRLLQEIGKDNPQRRNLSIIAWGFVLWLALALATNGITLMSGVEFIPLFSFVQLFPSIMVVGGFMRGERTSRPSAVSP
ncbi:MAG: hypothetical protein QCI38_03325 [Candidatus Thermoplasmatota archaeon]|nr:hypothetical protein [Candidatus Thermoplasmatota archaeon]